MKVTKKGSRIIHVETNQGRLQFSCGNKKVSSNTLLFSLPAGSEGSCIMSCPSCYARKMEKLYPNVYNARNNNFQIIKKDLDLLKESVIHIMEKYSSKFSLIRIHEGGDFYSQNYASTWDEIARIVWREYGVRTYSHTKTDVEVNNIHLVSGFVDNENGIINYGDYKWVRETARKYNIPICPITRGFKELKCGDGCTICMENNRVLFVKH